MPSLLFKISRSKIRLTDNKSGMIGPLKVKILRAFSTALALNIQG